MSELYGYAKHKGVKNEYQGITFDSLLETEVYKIIRQCIGETEVVFTHHSITVREQTLRFRAKKWEVDFYVPSLCLYVEAKGFVTNPFKQTLELCDLTRPEVLDNLLVVSQNELKLPGKLTCHSLTGLRTAIANRQIERALLSARTQPTTHRGVSID